MKSKKGFTLIELLAVIVILAIIALIATPIVLDIINDTRNSSQLRSADFYLDAVEYAVSQSILDNKVVESGTYNIIEDGNICLKYKSDKVECIDVLKVDVSGGVPKKGSTITVIDGKIKKVNLQYEQSSIMKNLKGDVEIFKNEYEIGDEVVFNPGDGDRTWNVVDEDIDTVTLMLNENLGLSEWYAPEDNNSYGPITALNYLNTWTTDWTNVDPIDNYVYINNKDGNEVPNGYQKLEIKAGKAITISKDGSKNEIIGQTKARILSVEEVFSVAEALNDNYKIENLETYLKRHLPEFSALAGQTLTTVDQGLDFFVTYDDIYQHNSRNLIIFGSVSLGIINGLEDYDLNVPILLQDLYSNTDDYWLLTSRPSRETSSMLVEVESLFSSNISNGRGGVRPVITIPKSKLK